MFLIPIEQTKYEFTINPTDYNIYLHNRQKEQIYHPLLTVQKHKNNRKGRVNNLYTFHIFEKFT